MTKAEQMIHDYKEKERISAERFSTKETQTTNYIKYYICGAIIAVAAIGFGFLLARTRG